MIKFNLFLLNQLLEFNRTEYNFIFNKISFSEINNIINSCNIKIFQKLEIKFDENQSEDQIIKQINDFLSKTVLQDNSYQLIILEKIEYFSKIFRIKLMKIFENNFSNFILIGLTNNLYCLEKFFRVRFLIFDNLSEQDFDEKYYNDKILKNLLFKKKFLNQDWYDFRKIIHSFIINNYNDKLILSLEELLEIEQEILNAQKFNFGQNFVQYIVTKLNMIDQDVS